MIQAHDATREPADAPGVRFDAAHRGDHDERFESDRETLPFPNGGVFGPPDVRTRRSTPTSAAATHDRPASHTDVIAAVERQLDDIQSRIDELACEADSIPFPSADDDWMPAA